MFTVNNPGSFNFPTTFSSNVTSTLGGEAKVEPTQKQKVYWSVNSNKLSVNQTVQ